MTQTACKPERWISGESVAAERPWEDSRVAFSISAFGRTDRGQRRDDNQDCILFETSAEGQSGLYAVADGMGGRRAGEIASAIAIATLREMLVDLLKPLNEENNEPDGTARHEQISLNDTVRMAVTRCNDRILAHAESHPENKGLGSTLNLIFIKGPLAIIANIGDSRAYRIRGNTIERLTQDHSLVAHLAAIGQISGDDVYTHPQRSYIYRALGSENDAQPDIITERLQSGDTLLLCSDGLWEMVRDDRIFREIENVEAPAEACEKLVDLANKNGGVDNIAVIVIKVQ